MSPIPGSTPPSRSVSAPSARLDEIPELLKFHTSGFFVGTMGRRCRAAVVVVVLVLVVGGAAAVDVGVGAMLNVASGDDSFQQPCPHHYGSISYIHHGGASSGSHTGKSVLNHYLPWEYGRGGYGGGMLWFVWGLVYRSTIFFVPELPTNVSYIPTYYMYLHTGTQSETFAIYSWYDMHI